MQRQIVCVAQKKIIAQNLSQNLTLQKVLIPPLKIQGIKSKLVPHIQNLCNLDNSRIYFEPFLGSGVVGFNLAPKKAIFSDTNPHIINFYNAIKNGKITKNCVINYLKNEGENLKKYGYEHYLQIRARFNEQNIQSTQNLQKNNKSNPLDFLFLNRSCFNGLMRFNTRGGFNVPYCKKDNRFAPAYITKIANQIAWVSQKIHQNQWEFVCCDFAEILQEANAGDFIYCDPPYIDRHSDYFSVWSEAQERQLYKILSVTKAKFILSTWHSNRYRENIYIKELWSDFDMSVISHFYHLGASESNRNEIKEALVRNYSISKNNDEKLCDEQMLLLG